MAQGAAPQPDEMTHASCVAFNDAAALIRGASGSGKSALALELMSRGAKLVSDDRTCLLRRGDRVVAYAPPALVGMIEARGVGILKAEPAAPTALTLVIDLDETETDRLPPARSCDVLGQRLPLLHKTDSAHFSAAISQYLSAGLWTQT